MANEPTASEETTTETTAPATAPVVAETARRPAPARGAAAKSRERTASGAAIVPPQSVAGSALVSVVAIMCFLACLAVGALALVREAASDWQLDVAREVTIQIKPQGNAGLEARIAKALDIARATAGVKGARLVDERESAALLEPWLGRGLDLSGLPIPRLVIVELTDPASADLPGLKATIGRDVVGAVVDDHAVWASRLRTMANGMVAAGAAIVVLVLAAMVLSVVFATRAAMAGNREVIEVLHFVGAEDPFIAREFQRHFLVLGLKGGVAGGAAAFVAFLAGGHLVRAVPGEGLADQAQALFGGFSVGPWGHLGVVAVVAVVAGLTAVTSRATVLGHLRRLE